MTNSTPDSTSVVAFGRATIDAIVTLSDDALTILAKYGLAAASVQFFDDFSMMDTLLREFEAGHLITWSSGGPTSNTICTMAICREDVEDRMKLYWVGPAEYSDFPGRVNPIDHLRYMQVTSICQYHAGYRRVAICIISPETREPAYTLIFSNDEKINADNLLPIPKALIISLSDFLTASKDLYQYITSAKLVALLVADYAVRLDKHQLAQIAELVKSGQLKWIFGKYSDFQKLGFEQTVDKQPLDQFKDIEFVGTNGAQPVKIWHPVSSTWKGFAAPRIESIEGNTLGAGDAYVGGYLYARLTEQASDVAHSLGSSCATRVLGSATSYIQSTTDFNMIFGKVIDRRGSQLTEGELFNRIRLSPGLVVISCGQTGVDQIAMQMASRLGLPAFAVLPQGRRTEYTEGIYFESDDFSDAYIIELSSTSYRYCTWANAFLSDGTLLWDYSDSEGSIETRKACEWLGRPYLDIAEIPPSSLTSVVAEWLVRYNIRVINIAGNRASILDRERVSTVAQQIGRILTYLAWHRINLVLNRNPIQRLEHLFMLGKVTSFNKLRVGVSKDKFVQQLMHRYLCENFGIVPSHSRKLFLNLDEIALEVFYTRARDLPSMLQQGLIDVIMCGDDLIDEAGIKAEVLVNTGLQPCHVVLVGKETAKSDIVRVGSQYPNLATQLLKMGGSELNTALIYPILGGAEAWIHTGFVDAAIDTWRTGFTAEINQLSLIKCFYSTALVIASLAQNRVESSIFALDFEAWLVGLSRPSSKI